MPEELTVQCEDCLEMKPESECEYRHEPNATLAFCESCLEPTYSQELGLGL